MICHDCRRDLHDRCRGGSWCTCQHRPTPQPLPQPPQEPEKGANH